MGPRANVCSYNRGKESIGNGAEEMEGGSRRKRAREREGGGGGGGKGGRERERSWGYRAGRGLLISCIY